MKKFLCPALAFLLTAGGCSKYDDSSLWEELESQAKRLASLEAWQSTVNSNIGALQTVVKALQANDYVTGVDSFATPLPGGYRISFANSPQATIWNGARGEAGEKGDVPQVSVGIEEDVYYWRVEGKWLTDEAGNKIPLTGGKDVTIIAPQLRISAATGEWEICTNGGCTDEDDWTSTGVNATGPQGDAIFAENGVDNAHPGYVELTLADGVTKIRVTRFSESPRFLSFGFRASDNPAALVYDVAGTVEDSVIRVSIPHVMENGKTLIPVFAIAGSGVSIGEAPQQSGVNSADFSSPVIYTVTHSSGATKRYTVRVTSFTGLPVVFINTKDRAPIVSKDDYVDATIRIIGTPDNGGDFSGEMKIKGRGNSTWGMPKKPYKMKFDQKTSLLGEPKDKEWVLLANYVDNTSLRNETALFMGRLSLLDWTPRTHFVEVFLNEVYDGTYQLCEQIKIAEDRVNVTDDGYLLEVDFRAAGENEIYFKPTNLNNYVVIKEPDVALNDARYHWIQDYVANVDALLYAENFDPATGYAQYVDIPSFVDWYLINEITKNNDSRMYSSCYMNIAPNGKLKMGPLWDFDHSIGNGDLTATGIGLPTGFWVARGPWFSKLIKDPAFIAQVKTRLAYFKSRENDILNAINNNAAYLKWSVIENNNRWETFYTVYYNPNNYAVWGAYENEVQYMKNWLNARFEWLEQAFQ